MTYAFVALISCLSGTILGWRLKKSEVIPPQTKKPQQVTDGRLQDIIAYLPEQDRRVLESALSDTDLRLSPITNIFLDIVPDPYRADTVCKSIEKGYWKPSKYEFEITLSHLPYKHLDTDRLVDAAKRRGLDVF